MNVRIAGSSGKWRHGDHPLGGVKNHDVAMMFFVLDKTSRGTVLRLN